MTDTEYESTKAFLESYRYAELDIRVRTAELERLENLKKTLCAQERTDMLFHLERSICSTKEALRTLRTVPAEVECAVAAVEDATLREILTQHYICACDFKEIAERLHYSPRHVRRLHRTAIESIPLSAVSAFKKRNTIPRANTFGTVQRT